MLSEDAEVHEDRRDRAFYDSDGDIMSALAGVAFYVHRRGYSMTPPERMPRLVHMDALCSLCKISRTRGNGFVFSYPPFVQYQPRGVA